jgi:hypothetical protein
MTPQNRNEITHLEHEDEPKNILIIGLIDQSLIINQDLSESQMDWITRAENLT